MPGTYRISREKWVLYGKRNFLYTFVCVVGFRIDRGLYKTRDLKVSDRFVELSDAARFRLSLTGRRIVGFES